MPCAEPAAEQTGHDQPGPAGLDRVEAWFTGRGWSIFDFQRRAWQAYLAGESGLIHAPTGTGKSLAALFGPLLEWLAGPCTATPPLRVLWVTPLRALAADTEANLRQPIDDLGLPWTVERRTGDTGSAVRVRQRKRLPSVLVTTPESLSLLLSYADHDRLFADLRAMVVDEWHELLGGKRGVQLELCLARLRSLRPTLRTWGLSATLANLERARDVLLGPGQPGRLVTGAIPERTDIESLRPAEMARFPWAGHLGTSLVAPVIEALKVADTTLLFTNTRSQAELWHQAILRARPDWLEQVALHHGSLDRGLRDEVETRLRAGSLRCVVATSSLDLGVDFSPVDQVLQIGSPKGVARLLQRAGRAGHQPGATSRVLCVPTHAFELVEIAAARRMAEAGRIEGREPLIAPLDVLAQHVVTRALGGGVSAAALKAEITATHAYAGLGDHEWDWVLAFVTRGGRALGAYPQYHRVYEEAGRLSVPDRRIAARHRMSVGTISSDAAMQVRFQRGGRLGHVEERFIARLKPGDVFLFGGRLLELVRVRDLTAYVRAARRGKRDVPRWAGGRLAISGTLAAAIRDLLDEARQGRFDPPEMQALQPLLAVQQRWSALPAADELLVEHVTSREGRHWFVYPFAGRLAHEGLSALAAWRIARDHPASFRFSLNDYGFELVTRTAIDLTAADLQAALSPSNLLADLDQCVNAAELSRRAFRDIARVAGLVFSGYPGRNKSARQLQASSGLIFDVLREYDADNLLLDQARREVMARELEVSRLQSALGAVAAQRIRLVRCERLTPMAFPLWAERVASQVSTESWRDRVARMAQVLETEAGA